MKKFLLWRESLLRLLASCFPRKMMVKGDLSPLVYEQTKSLELKPKTKTTTSPSQTNPTSSSWTSSSATLSKYLLSRIKQIKQSKGGDAENWRYHNENALLKTIYSLEGSIKDLNRKELCRTKKEEDFFKKQRELVSVLTLGLGGMVTARLEHLNLSGSVFDPSSSSKDVIISDDTLLLIGNEIRRQCEGIHSGRSGSEIGWDDANLLEEIKSLSHKIVDFMEMCDLFCALRQKMEYSTRLQSELGMLQKETQNYKDLIRREGLNE